MRMASDRASGLTLHKQLWQQRTDSIAIAAFLTHPYKFTDLSYCSTLWRVAFFISFSGRVISFDPPSRDCLKRSDSERTRP